MTGKNSLKSPGQPERNGEKTNSGRPESKKPAGRMQTEILASIPFENPNPVLRVAGNGVLVYANPGSSRLVDKMGWEEGVRLPEPWERYLRRLLSSGKNETREVACGRITYALVFAPVAEAGYVNIYGQDITARKQALKALRRSEERVKSILDNSLEAAYRRNLLTDQYDYISPVIEQITGYSAAEMNAFRFDELVLHIHPDDRKVVIPKMRRLPEGSKAVFEYRFRVKNGDYRWLSDTVSVIKSAKGRHLYRTGIVQDITARKKTEEELRRARDELESRIRERTAELYQRARQLSLLTSELMMTEQRERRRLADMLHDHLQQLLAAAKISVEVLRQKAAKDLQAALGHITELLDESIEASRSLTVELSPPVLYAGRFSAALQWLARWVKNKYGLAVDFETDGRAETEREDVKILIFQVVKELLFNVVKHAGVSRARVQLMRHEDAYLKVVVSDQGVGFEPASAWTGSQRPIEKSDQLSGGFGLFSIRERLERIGGRFIIESSPGKGARFTLISPMQDRRLVVRSGGPEFAAEPTGTEAVSEPDSDASGHSRRLRILLADDHAVVRQGIKRLLEQEPDISVVGEAPNGLEAIEAARRLRPDVILMDFGMPIIDGAEATRLIHAELPQIRIIGLSMFDEHTHAAAMFEAGAAVYCSKSGNTEILLAAIRGESAGAMCTEKAAI